MYKGVVYSELTVSKTANQNKLAINGVSTDYRCSKNGIIKNYESIAEILELTFVDWGWGEEFKILETNEKARTDHEGNIEVFQNDDWWRKYREVWKIIDDEGADLIGYIDVRTVPVGYEIAEIDGVFTIRKI
jgi:hypothetical protein